MALNEKYIVSSDIEHWYVNKDTGEPLANGTVYLYRDIARNVPKPVYQLSGAPPNYTYTSMGSVLNLSAVGTVQNSGGDNEVIYWYPYDEDGNLDLYYVVVEDAGGTVQFTREAWPNVTASNNPDQQDTQNTENQIANPTFTNTFLNPGVPNVYSVTGATDQVFEFAPNWDFIISGTGTVTVQVIPITGSQNVPTNPPYALDVFVGTGITSCLLNQRFSKNSGLWTSTLQDDVFLYGSYVAQNQDNGTAGVQMFYKESTPSYTPIVIVDGSFESPYEFVSGATSALIPASTNTDPDGYVDIYLSFATASHVRITSIQLVPSVGSPASIIPIDFNSTNRDEVFQGDYYIPRAAKKNIDSYLVGWDFPVNPFQFGSSGNFLANAGYIADQTIAAAKTGPIAWSRDIITTGLRFTASVADDAFYVLQYLSANEVKDMLGNRLSTNVFGYQNDSGSSVNMSIYLFRGPADPVVPPPTPVFPLLPLTIGTIATDGTFTLTADAITNGWTQIPRSGLPVPKTPLNPVEFGVDINSIKNDYGFSGWEINDSAQIGNTDKFAIVVTFKTVDATNSVTINSISCVPGDLPCRPAVKTLQETLEKCQYYYEKSYNLDTQPGDPNNIIGMKICAQPFLYVPSGSSFIYFTGLASFDYKVLKRTLKNPTFYAINGASGSVTYNAYINSGSSTFTGYFSTNELVATHWNVFSSNDSTVNLVPKDWATSIGSSTPTGHAGIATDILFHYVADMRYGI